MLVEPPLLAGRRLGQPGQLLIRREEAVAHDGRRRHLEVDRPEQRLVELGLLRRQLVRRRRGEPDDVDVAAQLLQHRADHVAPQRSEVMALVEDDRRHAAGAQRVDPLPSAGREQVGEPHRRVAAARDLALERRGDAGQLALAPARGRAGPARGLGGHRVRRLGGRRRALRDPARLRRAAQRGARVVEPRERLVGEAGDRGAGRGGDHAPRARRTPRRPAPTGPGSPSSARARAPARRSGAGSRSPAGSCPIPAARRDACCGAPPPGRPRTRRARAPDSGATRPRTGARRA